VAETEPFGADEQWFLDEVAKAMALAQARIDKNPKDAAALYALGISYGLRSNYYWVVKKAWHDSLKDATTARRLHARVEALEPTTWTRAWWRGCTITSSAAFPGPGAR